MQTIFDLKPAESDLSRMEFNYSGFSIDQYLEHLQQRANSFNSSIEYEAICDLQELAKVTNGTQAFDKYTKILNVDFAEITSRIFNE
jgi:hypothetical protein